MKYFDYSETIWRLQYKPGTWLDGTPSLIYGDGDGTVNIRSLEGCKHWQPLQKPKVFYQALPKTDHLEILRSNLSQQYIAELIRADEPSSKEYETLHRRKHASKRRRDYVDLIELNSV